MKRSKLLNFILPVLLSGILSSPDMAMEHPQGGKGRNSWSQGQFRQFNQGKKQQFKQRTWANNNGSPRQRSQCGRTHTGYAPQQNQFFSNTPSFGSQSRRSQSKGSRNSHNRSYYHQGNYPGNHSRTNVQQNQRGGYRGQSNNRHSQSREGGQIQQVLQNLLGSIFQGGSFR